MPTVTEEARQLIPIYRDAIRSVGALLEYDGELLEPMYLQRETMATLLGTWKHQLSWLEMLDPDPAKHRPLEQRSFLIIELADPSIRNGIRNWTKDDLAVALIGAGLVGPGDFSRLFRRAQKKPTLNDAKRALRAIVDSSIRNTLAREVDYRKRLILPGFLLKEGVSGRASAVPQFLTRKPRTLRVKP